MGAVLITVMNGAKVLDSGTGVVLGHDRQEEMTFVLTCAHTIRAIGRRLVSSSDNPVKILVNGIVANDSDDGELARLDLAVLTVPTIIGSPSLLKESKSAESVRCEGFTHFFKDQFCLQKINGSIQRTFDTVMSDGTPMSYLAIKPSVASNSFAKGLSGAPVYDRKNNVIGIARILDGNNGEGVLGYAIRFSPYVISLVQEKVNINNIDSASLKCDPDRPPKPAPPLHESLRKDDIQKNRWGGIDSGFGRRLTIEVLREYKRYFEFNAVVEATDDKPLVGPFVFHLHDTFTKSVIWIRKTNGSRAVLEEIQANGTFTFGVQFKDGQGVWRSLEYDLGRYKSGALKKKYD